MAIRFDPDLSLYIDDENIFCQYNSDICMKKKTIRIRSTCQSHLIQYNRDQMWYMYKIIIIVTYENFPQNSILY